MTFRLLFIGDVVGDAGCSAVLGLVPRLREKLRLDAVVANGENSAPGGRGITAEGGQTLLSVADFLTLGNHAFDADGHEKFLDTEERVVRPANLDADLPGRGSGLFEANGARVGVVNVLGRVFVERTPPLTSPFEAADEAVARLKDQGADVVVVDAHAEATSEKQALGYHLAGRAQVVMGTHTHIPTADVTVLPGGTAYATDVGMTGREGSIIGFDQEAFLRLFLGKPRRLRVATDGPVTLSGVVVNLDLESRKAVGAERVSEVWHP
ncbi:MAG: TIGR00282 family metallophosphoesterase [Rubrobacteraceae bacterium]